LVFKCKFFISKGSGSNFILMENEHKSLAIHICENKILILRNGQAFVNFSPLN